MAAEDGESGVQMFDELGENDRLLARDFARRRGYHLLLGAGASLGATNARGPLPNSAELIELLSKQFSDSFIDSSLSLGRAYQRACLSVGRDEVWRFLKSIFADCAHEDWYGEASILPWKSVWTLNIDDAFENAYEAKKLAGQPALNVVSWDDLFVDTSELRVVHLHGHVQGSDPRSLVFSFSEYIGAAEETPVWNQVLSALLPTEPFVIVGARLLDDPDVEAMVMGRTHSAPAPSFVVDPFISDGNAWELASRGFQIVKATGRDFFRSWQRLGDLRPLAGQASAMVRLRTPQLVSVDLDRAAPPGRAHDYLGGDAPLWWDAINGNIVTLSWYEGLKTYLNEWRLSPSTACSLLILYASRLCGTSSSLEAMCLMAAKSGVQVFRFDKSSRFDANDVRELAEHFQPLLVVVDNGSDFVDDIDASLKACADLPDARVMFLLSETRSNSMRVEGRLTSGYEKTSVQVPDRTSRRDARTIATHLTTRARLGRFEGRPFRDVVNVLSMRDIFSGMMDVSHGAGFQARVVKELSGLSGWRRELVLLLSLASIGGRDVSVTEAQFALGVSSGSILDAVSSHVNLSALVENRDNLLAARQRDRATGDVIEAMGAEDALRVVRKLLENLKPLVNDLSLRKRNRAAVLTGHLMGYRTLKVAFPHQNLAMFYSSLESSFGAWNGRYWEQRAICCKSMKQWSQAESFAGRAVSIFPAPYTKTTYGTILINRANDEAQRGAEWVEYYRRGAEQLVNAQSESTERTIALFAYLGASLELMQTIAEPEGPNDDAAVTDLRTDWEASYASLRVILREVNAGELSEDRAERLSAGWQIAMRSLDGGEPVLSGHIVRKIDSGFLVGLADGRTATLKFGQLDGRRVHVGQTVPVVIVRIRKSDGRLFVRPA